MYKIQKFKEFKNVSSTIMLWHYVKYNVPCKIKCSIDFDLYFVVLNSTSHICISSWYAQSDGNNYTYK